MNNQTPESIRPALAKGRVALTGIIQIGPAVGLKANDFATFSGDFYDLFGRPADTTATPPISAIVGKQPAYLERKVQHAVARATHRQALIDGRLFVESAIDTLKGKLGRRWTPRWAAIGFTSGSLRLSRDPVPTLTLLEAHYRAQSAHETASLDLTSAKVAELLEAIDTTHGAINLARDNEVAAKAARDASFAKFRTRLGALREELSTLLDDDDSRWYRFGFRRPIDGETPDLVEEVSLRLGGPGEVIVEWIKARLAVNYRVSWKITGSTDEPTQVGLFSDLQAIITGLAHGTNITVTVQARNSAGESAPMEATILVP
jgi:hypothetical protein